MLPSSSPTHTQPGAHLHLCVAVPEVTPGGKDTISEVKGQQSRETSEPRRFVKHDRDKDRHQRTPEEKHRGNQGLHLSALVRAEQRENKREKGAAVSKAMG